MDGMLLENGERKVPYDAWRSAVLREAVKGMVVRAFAELKWKRTLTVQYNDEGEIMRREMHLEPIEESLGTAPAGSVWMFSGILRMGDVIDAGDGGILWDSAVRYENERTARVMEALTNISKETGKTKGQISLNWLLSNRAVTSPIIGARGFGQLTENLTSDQMKVIDEASRSEVTYPYDQRAEDQQRSDRILD